MNADKRAHIGLDCGPPSGTRPDDEPDMTRTRLTDEVQIALGNLADFAGDLVTPTVRLGVTGLSRSGKTIFITALVHNLLQGGRLPLFEAMTSGRLAKAALSHQPNDTIPRFAYEDHIKSLLEDRIWPQSTRQVSELRITIDYESASFFSRRFGPGRLHLDIVDYPGEWLLDLALLGKDYRAWCADAIARMDTPARADLAAGWIGQARRTAPDDAESEVQAKSLAELYTVYLAACRADTRSLSMLPPGRFLLPGDLEGSPALTFSPLFLPASGRAPSKSMWALMERRYEAYRDQIVRPFFRDHFARLDRQIVLVDALQAANAGPDALADLETALTEILQAFRPGKASWLFSILSRRIDRVLFAATKADHLNQRGHDRLEALLRHLVDTAIQRARFSGARIDVSALAAIRATREAEIRDRGDLLPAIAGTPLPGETLGAIVYDGKQEIALFPGDLPADPQSLFERDGHEADLVRFIKFRPPRLERTATGATLSLPHIRLDRALHFLLDDKLA